MSNKRLQNTTVQQVQTIPFAIGLTFFGITLLDHPVQIGGPGIEVEIDESNNKMDFIKCVVWECNAFRTHDIVR